MPNLLSPASPARFWAWVRYFLAPADTDDLRITMEFADLDPHQKSILSDDFGVAISTQWLFDRLGGFTKIVDGRRFMLQFAHLLRARQKQSKAKVGPSKAPDFVIQDKSGKWHVMECKGTQSGRGRRDEFLQGALSQKQMLQIVGAIRGERLATGLAISHEENRNGTELRVVDPEHSEPLLTLNDTDSAKIEQNADRITAAQALGIIGLSEAAIEVTLPEDVLPSDELLRPTEARWARLSRDSRRNRAIQQLRNRDLQNFEHAHRQYEGRAVRFALPELDQTSVFNEISVRQGVAHDLLQEISSLGSNLEDNLMRHLEARVAKESVEIDSDGDRTTLTYGDLLFADLTLKRI
jgi:hypothetical protein